MDANHGLVLKKLDGIHCFYSNGLFTGMCSVQSLQVSAALEFAVVLFIYSGLLNK